MSRGGSGVTPSTVLFVSFACMATAKVCGAIDLSWWWVTMPLWAPIAMIPLIAVSVAMWGDTE